MISKILFVLGSWDDFEGLGCRIGTGYFFWYLNFWKDTVISYSKWMVQWVLIFLFPKPWEISKNLSNIIKTLWKVMMILKIWRAWPKNWACHAPLNFKKEIAVSWLILGLEEVLKVQNDEKIIANFLLFIKLCSSLDRFCSN